MEDNLFGQDWEIEPAGGETGKAFVAVHEDEKFFLKRNSSPFLAALSVENIVPKLIWTRRVENGDVITAQKWIDNGRTLTASEMREPRVARMIGKIHRSEALRDMLQRIEKKDYACMNLLTKVLEDKSLPDQKEDLVLHAKNYLLANVEQLKEGRHVVCHGDLNHNNWLVSEQDELYLVDWDGAMLADPANDLGVLLYQYIPYSEWRSWLEEYGQELTIELYMRVKWFSVCQVLMAMNWQLEHGRKPELARLELILKKILEDDEVYGTLCE
ncbi:putative aminoglycoside phosphotransferase [Listeria weihenstephanensis FSL R9-0317]|uniref:Phosphotransferase n=1 Tax=Listeria weihenstephanensis TaxID=1006155 RepID=A0A1S7FVH5_9LIST|nr:phosphotransferase family protein [Listeria weihenstephanensis]AQY51369.1 phosphotransferase [Listeria weihenstephanensis]EUJ37170.1 putative aminoglycoside phosphotransferase [Listeria weihenstephanensis FSL R9-0317]MBC1500838.1 phosphotransferase family protein [Listeria weihenstephanensis]